MKSECPESVGWCCKNLLRANRTWRVSSLRHREPAPLLLRWLMRFISPCARWRDRLCHHSVKQLERSQWLIWLLTPDIPHLRVSSQSIRSSPECSLTSAVTERNCSPTYGQFFDTSGVFSFSALFNPVLHLPIGADSIHNWPKLDWNGNFTSLMRILN